MKQTLLLLVLLLSSLPSFGKKVVMKEDSKIYQKSFTVSKSDSLRIRNIYGNVTVKHWQRNEVSIKITVIAESNSSKYIQNWINGIKVDINKKDNEVYAITTVTPNMRGTSNVIVDKSQVLCEVSMPAWLRCNISQKYGNINMPATNDGLCNLKAQYGNITGGDFSRTLNINVKYGKLSLGNVSSLNLQMGYCSSSKMGNANEINATISYSTLGFGNVKKMNLNAKYSKFNVSELVDATLSLSYSGIKINTLIDSLYCPKISYQTIDIKKLSPTFKSVAVSARYGRLNISLPSQASFVVDARNLKYGSCKVDGFPVRFHTEYHDNSNGFDSRRLKRDDTYKLDVNGGRGGTIKFNGNSYSHIKIEAEN